MTQSIAPERITKPFPVFDCDAHVNDPLDIWEKYVPESQKDLVRDAYWRDDQNVFTNGSQWSFGGGGKLFQGSYNPICIAGPQMTKKIAPHPADRRSPRSRGSTSSTRARTTPSRAPGDGPDGDRPGDDHPHHDGRQLPVRGEPRRRARVRAAYNDWPRTTARQRPIGSSPPGGSRSRARRTPARRSAGSPSSASASRSSGRSTRTAVPEHIFPGVTGGARRDDPGQGVPDVRGDGRVLGMHTFPANPWSAGSRTVRSGHARVARRVPRRRAGSTSRR